MGVNIAELLPKKEIELEDLKNKKIAIDASQMLYQFLSSIRQQDGTHLMDSRGNVTSHLMGLSTRITNLMAKNINLVFIFDGKPPKLKFKEQEERALRKIKAKEKLEKATREENIQDMYKYSQQTSRLNEQIIKESKEFIKALGLPVIQSPSEADAQAAFMCERKDVYAVASSDSDALIHGSPRLIRSLTLSTKRKLSSGIYVPVKPELIELKEVLQELNLKQDQLIALAILVGTDYNPGGVKGIGPKTALKLIHEYKDFDTLFKELKVDFSWKRIFAIYKSMAVMKNYQLNFKEPDFEKVKKILVDEHDFNKERVDKLLLKLQKEQESKKQKSLSDF